MPSIVPAVFGAGKILVDLGRLWSVWAFKGSVALKFKCRETSWAQVIVLAREDATSARYRATMSGRSMRQRAPVSYKASDMNQAKTPSWLVRSVARVEGPPMGESALCEPFVLALIRNSVPLARAISAVPLYRALTVLYWEILSYLTTLPQLTTYPQVKTSVNAPVPVREKKEKKTDPVAADKLAQALGGLDNDDDDMAYDSLPKPRDKKTGKENGEYKKLAAAKVAKAAKERNTGVRSKKHDSKSKKLTAMQKAAAVANDGLKRGHFSSDDDPSSHGSIHKHAGGRPAKRHARAMLHSAFDAAATPGSPDVMDTHLPARWPAEEPSPPVVYAPPPGRNGGNNSKKPSGAGRYGQLASAAAAAAAAAKNVIGSQGERLPAGRADGAWSSAYRTLQAAHVKLQTKYDKLKDTKLNGLIDEAETYRLELADHGQKAEELIKHFRGEADRQKEFAAGAEGASSKVYDLERENAELKEALLAYQGKVLRAEQEAAAQVQRATDEVAASTSGRWGTEELEAFMGLRWEKQSTGVHRFTHAGTGFAFQLTAADQDQFSGDDEETKERRRRESDVVSGSGGLIEEVSFTPLVFGKAEGYLPGYLSEAIEFERGEMPEFIGRMLGVLNQVASEHVAR